MSASGHDVNSLQFLYTLLKMKDPKGVTAMPYTFINKGTLLALMVPRRDFNIYGKFPFHKRFIIVE